eukprot:TRINITY_DN37618_c0_g1_i1.p1 TRINITY_DN37618_c0_g1~~TRINITY_DN37618_c0_g1_i1.p1  ORF type:complete len:168 (-),score=13.42 TRINITY_DN37618_c0_g1_i1:66-569(-)
MGVAVFLEKQNWKSYSFTLYTIVAIFVGRVFNIYPLSYIINALREKKRRIPMNHQHALWFSGLRGAMAFALALQSVSDLPDEYGRIFLTSTLLTIAFTVRPLIFHSQAFAAYASVSALSVTFSGIQVLFVGGATSHMLYYLNIECSGRTEGHEQVWNTSLLVICMSV